MAGFMNGLEQFGQGFGTAVASRSPIGRGAYQAATGQPIPNMGQAQGQGNIGVSVANSIIPRYKRSPGPTGPFGGNPQTSMTGSDPAGMSDVGANAGADPQDAGENADPTGGAPQSPSPVALGTLPQSMPGADTSVGDAAPGPPSSRYSPQQFTGGHAGILSQGSPGGPNGPQVTGPNSGIASPGGGGAGGGSSPSSGSLAGSALPGGLINRTGHSIDGVPPLDGGAADGLGDLGAGDLGDLAGLALAERGTIVTKPSLVRLAEHGEPEAVVPLTPRPGNRMQPDLLEGKLSAPKVAGVHYARYKSYGAGRSLMA